MVNAIEAPTTGNKGAETRANETKLFPLAFYRGRRLCLFYFFFFFFLFCIWSVGRSFSSSLMHILHFLHSRCAKRLPTVSRSDVQHAKSGWTVNIIGVWYDDDGCRRRRRRHHRYERGARTHTTKAIARRKYAELQISRWLRCAKSCAYPFLINFGFN